jgi:hypothetical protein
MTGKGCGREAAGEYSITTGRKSLRVSGGGGTCWILVENLPAFASIQCL